MICRDTMLEPDLGHSSREWVSLSTRSVRCLAPLPARIETSAIFSENIPYFIVEQRLGNVLQRETGEWIFLHQHPNHFTRRTARGKYALVVRRAARETPREINLS